MVKDEMILPPRVIGEIKEVNPSWVSLKVKRTGDLFELPWFSKAHLPHLHIRSKATGSNKPYEKEKYICITFIFIITTDAPIHLLMTLCCKEKGH